MLNRNIQKKRKLTSLLGLNSFIIALHQLAVSRTSLVSFARTKTNSYNKSYNRKGNYFFHRQQIYNFFFTPKKKKGYFVHYLITI